MPIEGELEGGLPTMHGHVFGELELRSTRGGQVLPTAAKPRTVFALLLTRANSPVEVDEIVDEVWGDGPPATARTALQCYVSQLRKSIAALGGDADPRDVLVTRGPTYRLTLDVSSVDVFRQQDLQRRGRQALADGRNDDAARDFGEALRLRRGRPLADVARGISLTIEAQAIDERCLNLEEMHVEAQLRRGGHEAVLDALVRLTAQYPLREGLQAQYLVALFRAGRRAEALVAYQTAYHRFVSETGLEPGTGYQQLHRQVLANDPALTDPTRAHHPTTAFPSRRVEPVAC